MKHFSDQNYYELLEVTPDASLEEITKAYQLAQEAFNPDSVAIYSLFEADEDREALLDRIQDAYRTLSNGRTRREYDRQLLGGEVRETDWGTEEAGGPEPIPGPEPVIKIDSVELVELPSIAERRNAKPIPLPSLIKAEGLPLEVEPGGVIKGRDLVRLRESRGVRLAELAERIRVNPRTLKALEADQHEGLPALIYVKGFLRAYAQVLKVDPELLTEAYIQGMKAG